MKNKKGGEMKIESIKISLLSLIIGLIIFQNNTFSQKKLEIGIKIPQSEKILKIEKEKEFKIHSLINIPLAYPPYDLSILKGGNFCALTDRGKNFIIYDLRKKKPIFSKKHPCKIYALAVHPHKDNILCLGDKEGKIIIFDADNLKEIHTIMEEKNSITDVKFSSDGTVLAVAHFGGTVSFYDTQDWSQLQETKIHKDSIYAIDLSPDSSFFSSASRDKTVRVTKLGETTPFIVLKKPLHIVLCVKFSPQGDFLSAGCADSNLYVWSVIDEEFKPYFEWTHGDWVTTLDFFNDYLFTGCKDGKIRIFNCKDKTLVGIFEVDKTPVMDIKVYPPLDYLIVATKKNLSIYDLKDICK